MKTVIITGAAGGLGQSMVRTFLKQNFRVIAMDTAVRIDLDDTENFHFYKVDVTDIDGLSRVAEELKKQNITIDVLINNAGIYRIFPVTDAEPEELNRIFQVNTLAPFYLIRTFLKDLIENSGKVIQICSENVKLSGLFQPYPSSKVAQESLNTAARQELKLLGVKLISIYPGAIDTPLLNWEKFSREESVYYKYISKFYEQAVKQVSTPSDPDKIANRICKIAIEKRPSSKYRFNNSIVVSFLSSLPQKIQDLILVNAVRS